MFLIIQSRTSLYKKEIASLFPHCHISTLSGLECDPIVD
jgi:hypothetical protein